MSFRLLNAAGEATARNTAAASSGASGALPGLPSSARGRWRFRMPCRRAASGAMNPRPAIRVERGSAVHAQIDGDNGPGQWVSVVAMREAIAAHRPSAVALERLAWNRNQVSALAVARATGAIMVAEDEERWRRYILDALIETTISRDIQLMTRIDKPALLRRLFALGCEYSGQILSYQKMVGQLQDAGNTTTLAHYLEVLGAAMVEPSLADASPGYQCQFERIGYFCADPDSSPGKPVFNRTVTLRDEWAKIAKAQASR